MVQAPLNNPDLNCFLVGSNSRDAVALNIRLTMLIAIEFWPTVQRSPLRLLLEEAHRLDIL